MDYHRDEKLREIRRLRYDDDSFPRTCFDLIRYVAVKTIRNPKMLIRQADICRNLYGVKGDYYKPTASDLGKLNRLMDLTRIELKSAYERPQSQLSPFKICLEKGNRGEGVCLKFQRRKFTQANTPPQIVPQAGGRDASALWERMLGSIEGIRAKRVFLLFDTPMVGLVDNLMDQRGQWAGSGEVSAAYIVGQHLSQLNRQVRLKRWRDLTHPELIGKFNCLIMLGSSLNNPGLKRLRTRDGLIPLQNFHFETSSSKDSRGCVYRGQLFENLAIARPPYEHREAIGSEPEIDYALISFFVDLAYKQPLISMAGITTAGTLAAASFMCSDKRVRELKAFVRKRCRCDLEKDVLAFEVLIKMHVRDGLPTRISLVDAATSTR